MPRFHLTARPWRASGVTREEVLTTVERACQFAATLQHDTGAVVDPERGREFQYATPYFACAVGVLLDARQGKALQAAGIAAMEHATAAFEGGAASIPDKHGEFFLAPLATGVALYEPFVDPATAERWRKRLRTPLVQIMQNQYGRTNNWRTYAMKGEWLRAKAGLVSRAAAVATVEDAWWRRTQRVRMVADRWNLYQDWSSDPASHAVEAVGRGNLLALVAAGYDGPSAKELRIVVERGTTAALLWQSPTGECPPNGRTDDHVFNDVVAGLGFAVIQSRPAANGDSWRAGQFRRAAALSVRSTQHWQREDGSFPVTKNRFATTDRVGYQPASATTNYHAAVAYHLAEMAQVWKEGGAIEERPTPAELGGYSVVADPRFGSAVLAAGGMQVTINLRGDTVPKYGVYWTPLGAVRFSCAGWDGRLGPGDGALDAGSGRGVTLGPTWRVGPKWVRLAEMAEHYQGTLEMECSHPLLVRCRVTYHSVTGAGGPTFVQRMTVIPDGVLVETECLGPTTYGVTLPVLVNDGEPLETKFRRNVVSTRFEVNGDSQNFLALGEGTEIDDTAAAKRGTYGWIRPVRVTQENGPVRVFIYPQSVGEPDGTAVAAGFRLTEDGFTSDVARVTSTSYVGRQAAGGFVDEIDVDGDGRAEAEFEETCGAVVQHAKGRVTAVEVDRAVNARIGGRELKLMAYVPVDVD